MLRKFFLKSEKEELLFPVTPRQFTVITGTKVQTVKSALLGEISLPGGSAANKISLELLLPKGSYSFSFGSIPPYEIIAKLEEWLKGKEKLRFIVSDTPINRPVFVEEISYGEKNMTGDVYAKLTIREYIPISLAQSTQKSENKPRSSAPELPKEEQLYTVKKGDTLWDIARRYYKDGAKCYTIALYNGIKNPDLIYAGTVLRLPVG